jgi:hypothetical protein
MMFWFVNHWMCCDWTCVITLSPILFLPHKVVAELSIH